MMNEKGIVLGDFMIKVQTNTDDVEKATLYIEKRIEEIKEHLNNNFKDCEVVFKYNQIDFE